MTKEQVFNLLNKSISHINERFCAEERELYLDDQLEVADLPFEYSIDSGITKAVIIIKGASFVIKIPFFKIWYEDSYSDAHYDWEESQDEAIAEYADKRRQETNDPNYVLTIEEIIKCRAAFEKEYPEPQADDEQFYYDVEGASNIDLGEGADPAIPDWDYCRLESVIYQLATEEGLGAYFAEEAYLGTIDNTPVYYQTRCTPMSSMSIDYDNEENSKKSATSKQVCKDLKIDCFNPIWIADFINVYGIEEFTRLNKFLNRYEITDLRTCNIGYLDGAPILFDYSGFRDW
jgi:hypothetical protein